MNTLTLEQSRSIPTTPTRERNYETVDIKKILTREEQENKWVDEYYLMPEGTEKSRRRNQLSSMNIEI